MRQLSTRRSRNRLAKKAKRAPNRVAQQLQSHPLGRGDRIASDLFNLAGRSPLVALFLESRDHPERLSCLRAIHEALTTNLATTATTTAAATAVPSARSIKAEAEAETMAAAAQGSEQAEPSGRSGGVPDEPSLEEQFGRERPRYIHYRSVAEFVDPLARTHADAIRGSLSEHERLAAEYKRYAYLTTKAIRILSIYSIAIGSRAQHFLADCH